MNRRCLNCMKVFSIPAGHENEDNCCPFCGFVENTPPKIITHLYPGMILQNRYIIGTVIEAGGFGVTYRAWDRNFETVVAVKEHFPAGMVQRTPGSKDVIVINNKEEYIAGVERFMDEARTLASFSTHPNIVRAENYFEDNNTAYLVMEYLNGITLQKFIKTGNLLDEKQVADVFLPIADALKEMHSKGVLHRDISPDNIFLCNGGKPKLIDFGAARLSDTEKEMTRSVILKPGFAPPEQYQKKSKQGPWTDIYALCSTMYNAVVGEKPAVAVDRLIEDEVVPPKKINPSIPEYLSNTIMKGMALSAELRFQDVDDLKRALEKEIKVDDPGTMLKKKKIIRVISIAAVVMIILVAGLNIAGRMKKDKAKTVVEDAEITVWLPYSGDEDGEKDSVAKEAKENYVRNGLMNSFLTDHQNVTVEVKAIREEDYASELDKALAAGQMPDLYMTDNVSNEVLGQSVVNKDIFFYPSEYDLLLIDKQSIENQKRIPTGFYAPVVFIRRGKGIDLDNAEIPDFDTLINDTEHLSGVNTKYRDILQKSFGISSTDLRWDKLCTDYAGTDAAYKAFINGDITYYLSTTEDYHGIIEEIPYQFVMLPIKTDKVYAELSDYWSVCGTSPENEKKAAEVAASYLLLNDVQITEHIENKNSIPLDEKAFETFIANDGNYELLNEYRKKMELN